MTLDWSAPSSPPALGWMMKVSVSLQHRAPGHTLYTQIPQVRGHWRNYRVTRCSLMSGEFRAQACTTEPRKEPERAESLASSFN